MSYTFIKCILCGKLITDPHGNRDYHDDCGYRLKKQNSAKRYAAISIKADPYWLNEKILRKLYKEHGDQGILDPSLLESAGFDFKLIKSETNSNGFRVYVMNKHGFYFLKNKKIQLWKQ